jgi:hypothetical protein
VTLTSTDSTIVDAKAVSGSGNGIPGSVRPGILAASFSLSPRAQSKLEMYVQQRSDFWRRLNTWHTALFLLQLIAVTGLVCVVSVVIPSKPQQFRWHSAFAPCQRGGIVKWSEVAFSNIEKTGGLRAETGNLIDRTSLVNARESFVSVTDANDHDRSNASSFWKMIDILSAYGCRNASIPIEWLRLIWKNDNLLLCHRAHVWRSTESMLLSAHSVPILRSTELRHKELYVGSYIGHGVSNVLERQLDLYRGLYSDVGIVFEWTYLLETKATHYRLIAPRLKIEDFYPRPLGKLQLLSRSISRALSGISRFLVGAPHQNGEGSVDDEYESANEFDAEFYCFSSLPLFPFSTFLLGFGWWCAQYGQGSVGWGLSLWCIGGIGIVTSMVVLGLRCCQNA